MNIRLLYRPDGTTSCISHFFDLITSLFHEMWRILAWKVVPEGFVISTASPPCSRDVQHIFFCALEVVSSS